MSRYPSRNSSYSRQPPPPGTNHYSSESYSSYGPPPPPLPADMPPPPPPSDHGPYSQERRGADGFRGPYSDLRSRPRRDERDSFRPPQSDFSFRAQRPAGIDSYRDRHRDNYDRPNGGHGSRYVDSHRGSGDGRGNGYDSHRPPRQENDRPRERGSRGARGNGRSNNSRGGPFRFAPRKAVDRLLLSKRHDGDAELMLGDTSARATYRDVDQLSDSDEADMDISDNSGSESAEPASKRVRTTAPTVGSEPEAPRWSNPDPYTALPPPDANARNKKDMVHLIRKARVEADAKKPGMADHEADFISFDMSDGEGDDGGGAPGVLHNSAGRANGQPNKASTTARPATSTLPPKPAFIDRDAAPPSVPTHPTHTTHPSAPRGPKAAPVDLTPSTALGNRKRTRDDKIKLPHASLKKVNRTPTTGNVLAMWSPDEGQDLCPWVTTDHSATPSMGTRLHKEIVDWFDYVRPRDFEEQVRQQMLDKLGAVVRKFWYDAKIYPFGSFMSGLYLPTADMDIAICSDSFIRGGAPKYATSKKLFQLRRHLEIWQVAYKNSIEVITKAKVPLLKYADDATGLKVDISFEKMDGHNAIKTFLAWRDKYPAMPALVAIIKHFLLMRGLNEPVNGGIGGFSVICMVVHLLHQMPQVQSGSMIAEHHLGEVLMEFFDLYGNKFEYETVAISMNPPRFINKSEVSQVVYKNYDRLSIIDPNNPANDIAGGSSNTYTVLHQFSVAYSRLSQRMRELATRGSSAAPDKFQNTILGPLLGGQYSHFQCQRDWLEKMAAEGIPDYAPKGPDNNHSRKGDRVAMNTLNCARTRHEVHSR
ncbi:hypothetical protein GGR56DRAFT_414254 [Xylariaceae sp. FL0804]|nr:hypothetical protein GGR56DRAFT_414254 [Xylariaceae sp. FL0804]